MGFGNYLVSCGWSRYSLLGRRRKDEALLGIDTRQILEREFMGLGKKATLALELWWLTLAELWEAEAAKKLTSLKSELSCDRTSG